jgi:hypothetical protein
MAEGAKNPVEQLEQLIVDIRRLKGEISILSDNVGKTVETSTSKIDKAVVGVNEAFGAVPKDKVQVSHVWRVEPSTKEFLFFLFFMAFVGFVMAWFLVKSARDESIKELQGIVEVQKERITELENKMIMPARKKRR